MCGNFGLLYVHSKDNDKRDNSDASNTGNNHASANDDFIMNSSYNGNNNDQYLSNEELVTKIFEGDSVSASRTTLKEPLLILEHQAANTEIRGGQAGGYSSFEYTRYHNSILGHGNILASISQHSVHSLHESYRGDINSSRHSHHNLSQHSLSHHNNSNHDNYDKNGFESEFNLTPTITRIRTVARKRIPLAGDLTSKYLQARKGKKIAYDKTFSGNGCELHSLLRCLLSVL